MLLVLFGGVAGQGVVWYTGMFYELFFIKQTLKIDAQTADIIVAVSLIIGTPFFIVFGVLSDKIGRKWIIMAGCLIAAVTYFPIFKALTKYGNPDLLAAQESAPVKVFAAPGDCTFQFDPVGKATFKSSCDQIKTVLARRAIPYENVEQAGLPNAYITVGATRVDSFDGRALPAADFKAKNADLAKAIGAATAMYPAKADPSKINYPMVILLLVILVIYVTMVYAPIGAWLVELFPARIRYTSMSLPYHIGNGWFGGFLPFTAFAIVAATGDIYAGLWYPIVVASMTFVVGSLLMHDTDVKGAIHHDS